MFFIVVANALVPGATVAWVTRRLGLQTAEAPAPQAVLAIESRLPLEGELMSFYVDEALVVAGATLEELEFPGGVERDADRAGQPADPAAGVDGAAVGGPRVRAGAAGGQAADSADVRAAGGGVGRLRWTSCCDPSLADYQPVAFGQTPKTQVFPLRTR